MATASVKNLATGGSSGILFTERRDFYLKPNQFAELYPDVTPFITLTMKSNFRTGLADPVFKLFQHTNPWERQYMQCNGSTVTIAAASAGAAAASDAITFNNITGLNSSIDTSFVHLEFEVWDTTRTTKKGVVLLTDDTSTTTAKFKNLGATAISVVDDDYFICIGNAQEEGDDAPDAWSDDLSIVWNQAQIFKTPIEVTGTLYEASLRGANKELARLRAQKAQEHKIQVEHAFLKGKAPLGTNLGGSDTFSYADLLTGDNSKVVRTTYGIIPAIEDYGSTSGSNKNKFTITEGSYKYIDFVDDMEIVFQYVPNTGEKYAIAGPGMMSFWSKLEWAGNSKNNWKVQISATQKDNFGFNVRKLETPHGVLNLVKSHTLKYEYNKYMVCVDNRNLEYVQYRPSKFMANIKTDNAYDGVKDQYFTDAGLGLTHVRAHNLFNLV